MYLNTFQFFIQLYDSDTWLMFHVWNFFFEEDGFFLLYNFRLVLYIYVGFTWIRLQRFMNKYLFFIMTSYEWHLELH